MEPIVEIIYIYIEYIFQNNIFETGGMLLMDTYGVLNMGIRFYGDMLGYDILPGGRETARAF